MSSLSMEIHELKAARNNGKYIPLVSKKTTYLGGERLDFLQEIGRKE